MSTMVVFIKVVLFIYVLNVMFTTIHSENLTWFEAQRCCASRSGQLAPITDPIVSCNNIPSHAETLWTGNIRIRSKWIEFQGCYALNGFIFYHNNISECYQRCLHRQHNSFKYFAFKVTQCICTLSTTRKSVNKNLCDRARLHNYSWVYKVLYNASFDGYGNCLASKCTNGKKVAMKCSSLQIPMCGLLNSTANWNNSQSNCKTLNSKENNATDMCELKKYRTTETVMWTNIFRVEISAHVDHGDMIKMTDISSCVVAKCFNNRVTIKHDYANCNATADAFFCKQDANSSTIMSSGDCKSQTTNINNLSKSHTLANTTSSVSTYTHQLSNRTHNHYSTESLTMVKAVSVTALNGNSIFKRTTSSSSLGTAITSNKLPAVVNSVDVTTTRRSSHTTTNITPTMDGQVGTKPEATDLAVVNSVDVTTTRRSSHTTNITPTMDGQVGTKPEATDLGLICGVTVGGVVLIAVIVIITCKMRNVGPFRKRLYTEDNIEMNNSIDSAIPVYHDTVLNTGNGSVPKDAIRNNTADDTSTSTGERKNKTSFSNHEYAVVVKKHPADPAAQPKRFDLAEDDNQSQRFETEDECDTLKHTVDKGEEQIENNVYDSSLGVRDGVDPTYNSIKIGKVNNDTTYDHTSNIVQKQVNSDRTYDLTSNIVQKQVINDATYDHTF